MPARISLGDPVVSPNRVHVKDMSGPDFPDAIDIMFGGMRLTTTVAGWRELANAVEAGISTLPEQRRAAAAWNVSRAKSGMAKAATA